MLGEGIDSRSQLDGKFDLIIDLLIDFVFYELSYNEMYLLNSMWSFLQI